jgi:hypothetical protein
MLRLYTDDQFGGKPRYYVASQERVPVHIPEVIRKSVAFACYRDKEGKRRYAGTVFFLQDEVDKRTGLAFTVTVTAKHVILKIVEKSIDQVVLLDINLRNGGSDVVPINASDWIFNSNLLHPTDVAVCTWCPPGDIYDWLATPMSMIATDDLTANGSIGLGNEVFTVGLFKEYYGQHKNQPIVRIGNVAMLPDELVPTRDFGDVEAYLVECRSTSGLSGSPVFVEAPIVQQKGENFTWKGPAVFWLGLIHGHYDIPLPKTDALVNDSLEDETINMGIAIVIPANKIIETINQPEILAVKEKELQEYLSRHSPTPDSLSDDESISKKIEEKPYTEEDFEAALRKVSRPKQSPSDEEKYETSE